MNNKGQMRQQTLFGMGGLAGKQQIKEMTSDEIRKAVGCDIRVTQPSARDFFIKELQSEVVKDMFNIAGGATPFLGGARPGSKKPPKDTEVNPYYDSRLEPDFWEDK